MIDLDWTDEDRILWERTFAEDHVKRGLLKILLECLPTGARPIEPGLDLKEISSQAHAFLQGQVAFYEKIDSLKIHQVAKPLPKPFQAPLLKKPADLDDPT